MVVTSDLSSKPCIVFVGFCRYALPNQTDHQYKTKDVFQGIL